jgi:hypothetical protein
MVGIIVNDGKTVLYALVLKTAVGAGKGGQAFYGCAAGDAQPVRGCDGGQRVAYIVHARNMEGNPGLSAEAGGAVQCK